MANLPAALSERLNSLAFNPKEARDAVRGKAVPKSLGRKLNRICVIRGIRYHDAFAKDPQTQELRALPEFARALNARAIMSNDIPDMTPQETPYCIWHPNTATEETYRELVRRYPDMAYQVARACAVAGYTALYSELEKDILPDVAVAEEARASRSQEIFNSIMSKPARYRVMDDYTRAILKDAKPSCLNGDTAVRATLDSKQGFRAPKGVKGSEDFGQDVSDDEDDDDDMFGGGGFDDLFPDSGFDGRMYDITEDMCIDEASTPEPTDEESGLLAMAGYLAKPLPSDLPAGNKDVLILAAAYSGNVDRYARLRRPKMVEHEAGSVVRGIYHCHFFATWWATQTLPDGPFGDWIAQAINARMIMSNDLSRLTPDVPSNRLPYLIWYPAVAQSTTYAELAKRVPAMKSAILRAAVYSKDRTLFDSLLNEVEPDPYMTAEAKSQDTDESQSYFTRGLLARAQDLGLLDIDKPTSDAAVKYWGGRNIWKRYTVQDEAVMRSSSAVSDGPAVVGAEEEPGIYNGVWADASLAELFASVPVAWRPAQGSVELDYTEWPRQ